MRDSQINFLLKLSFACMCQVAVNAVAQAPPPAADTGAYDFFEPPLDAPVHAVFLTTAGDAEEQEAARQEEMAFAQWAVAPSSSGFGAGLKVVSAEVLDNMRGGFETPLGKVSFGFERAVYVNGELLAAQTLKLTITNGLPTATLGETIVQNVSSGLPSGEALAKGAQQQTVVIQVPVRPADPPPVQTGSGNGGTAGNPGNGVPPPAIQNASGNGVATGAAANGVSPPAIQIPARPDVGTVVVQSSSGNGVPTGESLAKGVSPPVIQTPARPTIGALVVQNGFGNVVTTGDVAAAALPLVVQNTLDNQTIRTVTVINATVPAMSALNSISQMRSLGEAIANAATRR